MSKKSNPLTFDKLIKIFRDKETEFLSRYDFKPNYVKMPLCLFDQINMATVNFYYWPIDRAQIIKGEPMYLFGFKVCWTETIEKIEDIELF